METIFDHNPTDRELKRWGGRESFEYFEKRGINQFADSDTNNYMIAILYAGRGDYETSKKYKAKIKDPSMVQAFTPDF